MRYARQFPTHAIFCALAVCVCDLIAQPFTTMSVCDDGPYIRMAQTFANTGHIVYNGWAAMMVGAQLVVATLFIKLFGFSDTSVRMSTLPLAVLTAFLFHRTLVRTGISERNATLGTLAVVISPIYLSLSATFMTDIDGLFGMTLCLYACIRAIQAPTNRSASAWICIAVFASAAFGTCRQIVWLGNLVMVPSALWLLRARRRVLLIGVGATGVGVLFILGCMHWLGNQPYAIPMPLFVRPFPMQVALRELIYVVLEIPFLILPVMAAFIPRIFRSRSYIRFLFLAALLMYLGIAIHTRKAPDPIFRFEPTLGGLVNLTGVVASPPGTPDILGTKTSIVLTILCLGGFLGVIAVAFQPHVAKSSPATPYEPSWKQLGVLLLPFSIMYLVFLADAAGITYTIFDRYALELLGPTMIVLLRLYQDRVQPRLPFVSVLLIIMMGACGIIFTHNSFALDRARVDLANELHANGVPFTSIDGGWDYNLDTELDNSDHINHPLIKIPAHAYVAPSPAPPGYCEGHWHDRTPHVRAVYAISPYPNLCYGRAPFAPVQYRPWPLGVPVNIYAVRYAPFAE